MFQSLYLSCTNSLQLSYITSILPGNGGLAQCSHYVFDNASFCPHLFTRAVAASPGPGVYHCIKSKARARTPLCSTASCQATAQASGMTHIWLPPPSQSVAPQGYLPGQLYNLSTPYGNQEELKTLTTALKAAGVQPIADIVINHRCAGAALLA